MADMTATQILKTKIERTKVAVKESTCACKSAAKALADAHRKYVSAEELLNRKNSQKNLRGFALARDVYDAALKEYLQIFGTYYNLVEEVLTAYDSLILEDRRKASKFRGEAEKYEEQQNRVKANLAGVLKNVNGIEEALTDFLSKSSDKNENAEESKDAPALNEEQVEEAIAEAVGDNGKKENYQAQPYDNARFGVYYPPHYAYQPPHYFDPYRAPAPRGVDIAPVNIDITPMIEDAVAVAMEKFKIAIAKEIDSSLPKVPSCDVAPVEASTPEAEEKKDEAAPVSHISAVEEGIFEDEKFVSEKLVSLVSGLKELMTEISSIGAVFMNIANQQKDIAELQRKINDMQRALTRELQGVQVNQKVIAQDQVAVAEEQALVLEEQKANLEAQKLISAAQKDMAQMQSAVIETQNALEDAMRGVIRSQKDIISQQQALINGSAKNAELQKDLAEKQAELNAMQKEIASQHKQISRAARGKKAAVPYKKDDTVANEAENIVNEVQEPTADAKSDGEVID